MLNRLPRSSTHKFRLARSLRGEAKRHGLVAEEGTAATFGRWFSLRLLSWIAFVRFMSLSSALLLDCSKRSIVLRASLDTSSEWANVSSQFLYFLYALYRFHTSKVAQLKKLNLLEKGKNYFSQFKKII